MRAASTAPTRPIWSCSTRCAASASAGAASSPLPAPTCARDPPTTWSAIEYAAHSRDVTAMHAFGVEQALTRDEPTFPPLSDDVVEPAARHLR